MQFCLLECECKRCKRFPSVIGVFRNPSERSNSGFCTFCICLCDVQISNRRLLRFHPVQFWMRRYRMQKMQKLPAHESERISIIEAVDLMGFQVFRETKKPVSCMQKVQKRLHIPCRATEPVIHPADRVWWCRGGRQSESTNAVRAANRVASRCHAHGVAIL